MFDAPKQEKPETKICESCGAEFSCGANVGQCWCFDVEVKAETLTRLKENFEHCLCGKCLEKSADNNTSETN